MLKVKMQLAGKLNFFCVTLIFNFILMTLIYYVAELVC